MRSEKEIKADLLAALDQTGDDQFAEMGFSRRKGSLNYIRIIRDARQTVAFSRDLLPRYQPDKELHLHPAVHIAIKRVEELALQLVDGDVMLLANAPDIIVNQPVEFTAPKSDHVRWFASGIDEMKMRVSEISKFVKRWVMPFLDKITTPDELIEVYKNSDERMLKQHHWYLFVAAAYQVKGSKREALSVLEKNLGAPGLRKRYSAAFEKLSST